MSVTFRAFAYNPTHINVPGSITVGDLTVVETITTLPTGLTFWSTADDSIGYIICVPVPAGNQPTPLGNIGNVAFYRSEELSDASFLNLVKYLSNNTVTSTDNIETWLSTNGYWSSWGDWYGIEIDEANSSPEVTRIANDMTLHAKLPIHNNIKACLLNDNGTVNYYLKADDWTKKSDDSTSNLDGTDGQVMMEWPDFYFKVESNYPSSGKHQIKISINPLSGFTMVRKHYISAYMASIHRPTSKLASVVNTTTDYRGGDNTSSWDGLSNTLLGKSVTNINRINLRTYSRNRGTGWNINSYDDYKWLFWFFVIEYATLNSQNPVNSILTVNGYKQGGLGSGVTTAVSATWATFNNTNPFINNGVTNSIGNGSGEVTNTVYDFGGAGVNVNFDVPRYRGHENPFGHLWNKLDGVIVVDQSVASGNTTQAWISDKPNDWNDSDYSNYTYVGNLPRSNGFIKSLHIGSNADFFAKTVGGSSNTYYCDYFYQSIPATDIEIRVFIVNGRGASSTNANLLGMSYSSIMSTPSEANAYNGTRLSYLCNQPEVNTYITGLETPLSTWQINNLNTLVSRLKSGLGILALSDFFDVMYILAGETAESSLKNLVKNSHHATAVNNPIFTTYEGFTGDGTSSYINTNYNPNTQGVNLTQNNASAGIYSRTEEGSLSKQSVEFSAGDATSRIVMAFKYNNSSYRTINTTDATSLPTNTTTLGSYIGTRYNATSQKYYLNKFNQYTSTTSNSTGVPNQNVFMLAGNYSGSPLYRSIKQLSLGFIGRSVNQSQVDVIHDAFEAYMNSNGKGVVV